MITVTIEKNKIKASGHAGTAPKGQDLVCAAFTMLCHSLIESFRKLTADSFIYKIDSGSFYFECALPSGKRKKHLAKARCLRCQRRPIFPGGCPPRLVCERCRWQIQRAKRAQQRSEFRSIIHYANEIQGTALRAPGSC